MLVYVQKAADLFIKFLPVFLVLFPALGYLYAANYYYQFGILIQDYLEASEVLLLFSLEAIFAIGVFFYLTHQILLNEEEMPPLPTTSDNEHDEKYRNPLLMLIRYKPGTVRATCFIFALGIATFYIKYPVMLNQFLPENLVRLLPYGSEIIITVSGVCCLLLILSFYNICDICIAMGRILGERERETVLMFSVVFLFLFTILWSKYMAERKIYAAPRYMDIKLADGSRIHSNKDTLYIGRTKNYTLFFIKKDSTCFVINNASISAISTSLMPARK